MTTWNKQTETPLPFNTTLILTDGKYLLIGLVDHHVNVWPDGSKHEFYFIHCDAVSGYEWEVEFSYKEITHWMEAPELPKE